MTTLGLRHSEWFGNVLAQSAALWWRPQTEDEPEWLARQFVTSPGLPLRFYLDVGRLEDYTQAFVRPSHPSSVQASASAA